jgi:TusA-related sulfurtransferase
LVSGWQDRFQVHCSRLKSLIGFSERLMGKDVKKEQQAVQPHAELDLRGVICPYNFVKTKLKLETMEPGQILSVILDAGDPIRNVPMSVSNEGHEVLSQEPLQQSYRVFIRRS